MTRIRLIIKYDGANYVGWQTQPNGVAVQAVLEAELKKLTGEACALHASGRTDSGVHALAQVAHFDTESRIPPDKFAFALNAGLPADIRVAYSDEAPAGFHARYDVVRKEYRYVILNSPHGDPFLRDRALHIHYNVDEAALTEEAGALVGTHDFAAFKAAGTSVKSTVRTVFDARWSRDGELLIFDVAGSGFMYNMVRIMVGTMLDVAMDRLPRGTVKAAVEGGDRRLAGATAPAQGLYLLRVVYPDLDTRDHVPPKGALL